MLIFIDRLVGRRGCDELACLGRVQNLAEGFDAAPIAGAVFSTNIRRLQLEPNGFRCAHMYGAVGLPSPPPSVEIMLRAAQHHIAAGAPGHIKCRPARPRADLQQQTARLHPQHPGHLLGLRHGRPLLPP